IAKITATGGESTTLTATVTDAAGHAVPDATVDWSTTAGDLAGATSNTGADGKATVTFTAVRTETTNGTATITAGINSTT
ncbi:Ig-like domain-containing protein, partial [Bacillus pseudomycoides]